MPTSSTFKHAIHVIIFFLYLTIFELATGGIRFWSLARDSVDPWSSYGTFWTLILYALRLTSLLALPQCIFNHIGLTLYDAFRDKVQLRGSPLLAPFVCLRVVTRGDYPDLVKNNVAQNMDWDELNGCFDVATLYSV
uniref:Uncharacterized protein n=1 Tax=Romanomermis culicivorax TaxID=13658 RepID=A0A915JDM4_ROMCU